MLLFPSKMHEIAAFPVQNALKRCFSASKCIKMPISPFKMHQNKMVTFRFKMHREVPVLSRSLNRSAKQQNPL